MRLAADENIQSISTSEMKYRHGRPEVREYDSCYYEIGAAETNTNENNTEVTY